MESLLHRRMSREHEVVDDRRNTPDRRSLRERRIEALAVKKERRGDEERRKFWDRRRRTLLSAMIIFNNKQSTLSCTVRNLSDSGAKLVFGDMPTCPNTFDLDLGQGRLERCEVVYRLAETVGVRFVPKNPRPVPTLTPES